MYTTVPGLSLRQRTAVPVYRLFPPFIVCGQPQVRDGYEEKLTLRIIDQVSREFVVRDEISKHETSAAEASAIPLLQVGIKS